MIKVYVWILTLTLNKYFSKCCNCELECFLLSAIFLDALPQSAHLWVMVPPTQPQRKNINFLSHPLWRPTFISSHTLAKLSPHLTATVSIVCTAHDLNCFTFSFLYSIRRHVWCCFFANRAIVKCFFGVTIVWNIWTFFLFRFLWGIWGQIF